MAYINLFPTYANNEQLGTKGDKITAYQDHLRQYVEVVRPSLLSYDHYQFSKQGDNPDYFLNLMMIRRTALDARVPFLNIVQACTWTPSMRVPSPDEVRFLIYTTLAYGGQGISYYVYCFPGHTGGIALSDGTPTPLYHALTSLNREFVAVAKELQPLRSMAVYHTGMSPPGTKGLPSKAKFRFDPPIAPLAYSPPERVRGFLLGYFGTDDEPSHVVAVNLDDTAEATVVLAGPGSLQAFDAKTGEWSAAGDTRLELRLPPGGGKLVRVARSRPERMHGADQGFRRTRPAGISDPDNERTWQPDQRHRPELLDVQPSTLAVHLTTSYVVQQLEAPHQPPAVRGFD